MTIKHIITRFRQMGGFHLVKEYVRLGYAGPLLKEFLRSLTGRQSFKTGYSKILQRIVPDLNAEYYPIMKTAAAAYDAKPHECHRSDKVWFCWIQGMDKAPDLVKACLNSQRKWLHDKEIVIVDGSTWQNHVEIPDYIVEKYRKGLIPQALFSDIIRLELLLRHGGTWIDSTVLCTGDSYDRAYLDSDLFMFQYGRPCDPDYGGISNWFITSCTQNRLLTILRDMLYAYWKDHDCALNYYIFHSFFSLIQKEYPEEAAKMPYGSSMASIALGRNVWRKYDAEKFAKVTQKTCFHKLNYRQGPEVVSDKENYYNEILRQYTNA